MTSIPPEILADPELQRLVALRNSPFARFTPRPDNPAMLDQQTSFVNSKARVSVLLGGNGSGKSVASAFKVAKFLLQDQPPPRPDTPFWMISESLHQVVEICWRQSLSGMIPADLIDWPRCTWQSSKLNQPGSIVLKPWPNSPNNWLIRFMSTESGREKFQGISIGGAWFSEQFEWSIFTETLRGMRDHYFPGGCIVEATPINPDLSVELETLYDDPPDGWEFFRLNTMANHYVSDEWKRSFFGSISEEMRETRMTGAFASYDGQIYQSFNPQIHLVGDDVITHPEGVRYRRGIDWGESLEHPFAYVAGYRDGSGRWFIFDEWLDDQACDYEYRADVIRDRWLWKGPEYGIAYADPSRPMMIGLFNRLGVPCGRAVNRVHEGIEHVRGLLKTNDVTGEPCLFIHRDRCPMLAQQLRKYRWLRSSGRGLNPRSARPEPLKRDDDLVDALRYLTYSEASLNWELPDQIKDTHARTFKLHGVDHRIAFPDRAMGIPTTSRNHTRQPFAWN